MVTNGWSDLLGIIYASNERVRVLAFHFVLKMKRARLLTEDFDRLKSVHVHRRQLFLLFLVAKFLAVDELHLLEHRALP